jgi:hypothetical protein
MLTPLEIGSWKFEIGNLESGYPQFEISNFQSSLSNRG